MANIVITGSTRGIGLCMAREFLEAGCTVTASGRSEKSRDAVMEALPGHEDRLHYIPCDVGDKSAIEKLWNAAVEKWGPVDIWINNAGQNCPNEFVYDTKTAYVDRVIDTNIKGVVYGSQVAAKNMLAQGSGRIWNMEGLGSDGMIIRKTILYGMTKRALTYFTKGLAKELAGTPVRAGLLSPGMMLTDFITKDADGAASAVMKEKPFRTVFNILADRPETVAAFLVPRMLRNRRRESHIVWLTSSKAAFRFATAAFRKRALI